MPKKVQIPFAFPPKITTNSPINTMLHHTFKGLAFGKRELSKEKKKLVKPFIKIHISQIENQTFVLPFESKSLALPLPLLLLIPEYPKVAAQSSKPTFQVQGKSF